MECPATTQKPHLLVGEVFALEEPMKGYYNPSQNASLSERISPVLWELICYVCPNASLS
jgi:hypothetical protein